MQQGSCVRIVLYTYCLRIILYTYCVRIVFVHLLWKHCIVHLHTVEALYCTITYCVRIVLYTRIISSHLARFSLFSIGNEREL